MPDHMNDSCSSASSTRLSLGRCMEGGPGKNSRLFQPPEALSLFFFLVHLSSLELGPVTVKRRGAHRKLHQELLLVPGTCTALAVPAYPPLPAPPVPAASTSRAPAAPPAATCRAGATPAGAGARSMCRMVCATWASGYMRVCWGEHRRNQSME